MVQDCTVGKKTRLRTVARWQENGGKRCKGGLIDKNYCNSDCQCLADLVGGGIVGNVLGTVAHIIDTSCPGTKIRYIFSLSPIFWSSPMCSPTKILLCKNMILFFPNWRTLEGLQMEWVVQLESVHWDLRRGRLQSRKEEAHQEAFGKMARERRKVVQNSPRILGSSVRYKIMSFVEAA